MAETHAADVRLEKGMYRGYCACGWAAKRLQLVLKQARGDARRHELAKAKGIGV